MPFSFLFREKRSIRLSPEIVVHTVEIHHMRRVYGSPLYFTLRADCSSSVLTRRPPTQNSLRLASSNDAVNTGIVEGSYASR